MTWLAYLILLFGLSCIGVGIFRAYAIDKGMLDQPGPRSSHIAPTPRGGGVIFFFGWLLLIAVLFHYRVIGEDCLWLFSPAAVVGLMGFWEDHKGLSVATRFFIQCLCAIGTLFFLQEGGYLLQDYLPFAIPLPIAFFGIVFLMVWMVNLYNFMDGSDGMAAMQGIFIFSMGGFFLFQAQGFELAILAWGLVALLMGFLVWNWPVAQVFMGDCGSYFLGFLVSVYALVSNQYYQIPLAAWGILTSLFWFDATITLVRRMLAGQKWYEPHRSHAYQRMIQHGWGHRKVLIASMFVNAVLSVLAWICVYEPRLQVFAFAGAVIFLLCLYLMVEAAKPMFVPFYKN
ncbi:glycosyltransferase family 4 protein [Candidatus Berkiella aquae]|uniref:Glycosyltransferase family 4 protein n=1 Tax=Candidatus Berkiella aquae TaxID=295108 RepID=A0A0Q9YRT7_9GAMM|nr:glycosyltransferase family 4 protein [Candidatus Berkiella aquae]MCS5712018.1 glycosyltransferase family 4 protein [Candidatus Berkiella aquae]